MKKNAKKAGSFLTRKFGPLPAWAWLGIFAVAVYYYRSKISSTVSNTGTTSDLTSTGANTGGPIVLQPGETAFSPGTGQVVTAPGGGGGNSPAPPTTYSPGGGSPAPITGITTSPPPPAIGTNPTGQKTTPPKLRGRGAIRAPFGSKKPKAPKGYRDVGLGKGFWEFVPAKGRKRRAKAGLSGTAKATTGSSRRSGASMKRQGRAKQINNTFQPATNNRSTVAPKRTAQRSRPTQPVVERTSQNQRPEAKNPPARPAQAQAQPGPAAPSRRSQPRTRRRK